MLQDKSIDIEKYLPQRGDILLISEVYEITADSARAGAVVKSVWPLSDGETVNSLVLVEAIGQTAALADSYNRKSCDLGWVVGYKQVDIYRQRIPINTKVELKAKCVTSRNGYGVIEGSAGCNDEVFISAIIQVLRIERGNSHEPHG